MLGPHLEGVCFGIIHVLIDATAVDLPGSLVRVDQVATIQKYQYLFPTC